MFKKELQKLVSLNTNETEDFTGKITFYKKECGIDVFIGEDYCNIQISTLRGKPFFKFYITNIRQDIVHVTVILDAGEDKKEFAYTKICRNEAEEIKKINEIMKELQKIKSIQKDINVMLDILCLYNKKKEE